MIISRLLSLMTQEESRMDQKKSEIIDNKPILTDISLKKYHYRYLGALERDLDSFNRQAGLPVEIVEALHRLHILARHSQQSALFVRSPLLQDFVEFLLKMPEGLVPAYYASRICTGRSEQAVRGHLKTLPLENYCALRCVAFFIKSVSFSEPSLIPFEVIDKSTGLCEAMTPAPRDDRFKPILINIFMEPSKYFFKNK